MRLSLAAAASAFLVALSAPSDAKDMPYSSKVSVKVGQSVLVMSIRHKDCGAPARAFSHYKPQLPKSKLGTFSDGGVGTSSRCKAVVPARGVIFTVKKPGTERLRLMGDPVSITVK